MEWERQGLGTSANNMLDANPENSGKQQRTVVDEPMPETSLTSKRQRDPEVEGKNTVENKKKKDEKSIDKFESILEHLKVIVEKLESSNFSNIEEVLRMYPTLDVERGIGSIIAMTGSMKPEGSMPRHQKILQGKKNSNKK